MRNARPLRLFNFEEPTIWILALTLFFWTMFDASVSYLTPLLIANRGFSDIMLGLIIGSSSVFGGILDFVISRYLHNANYKRLILAMLILCAVYPLILGNANTLSVFILAMAVWGVYYDLSGYGLFDFVSRYIRKDNQPGAFGGVQVLRSLAVIIAPIVVSAVLVGMLFSRVFIMGEVFIAFAFAFFIVLVVKTRNKKPIVSKGSFTKKKNLINEIHIWRRVGRKLLPCLVVTFFLFTIDSFFWTIGPLYAVDSGLGSMAGFFMAAYSVPILLSGLIVGNMVRKRNKRRIAFISLMVGSVILSLFMLSPDVYVSIAIVSVSALFFGISLPSINGAYTEYIGEIPVAEVEIEAMEDFSFNTSYFIGPIAAGLLAGLLSISVAFSIIGVAGFAVGLALLVIVHKNVRLYFKDVK